MTPREVFAPSMRPDDEVTQVTVGFDEVTRVDHAAVFDEPTRVDVVFDEPARVTRSSRPTSHVRVASFVLLPVTLALAGVSYGRPAMVRAMGRAHASPGRVEARAASAAASSHPDAPSRAPDPPSPALSASRPIESAQSHRGGPPPDERAAVEAVATGAYDRAARLYDALAASHPDRDAYREAARILRAGSSTTRERP